MGSTCNYCPGEPITNNFTSHSTGFPQYIQSIIFRMRETYKDQINNIKDYQLPNGKLYKGILLQGKKTGYGEYYNGNNAYFGLFKNDIPEGEGLMIKDFKDYIKGTFIQGKLNGKVQEKINRNEFFGEYAQGQKVKGMLTTDTYTYEGGFKNNKFDGYGVLQFKNGDKYEGNFKDGLYHGDGKYETVDQGLYQGQFKNGLYDGKGIFRWKEDYYYEGEYKGGVRNGFGKFTKGKQQYEGFWIDGQPQNNSKFIKHQEFNPSRKSSNGGF